MISFEDLSEKSRAEIRSNQKLSDAFTHYFKKEVGREPSFCCTFKDYYLLFNPKKIKMSKSDKYNVDYPKSHILAYRNNGRTYRATVGSATDDFLKDFLKYHAEAHFPDAKKRIVLKDRPKKVEKPKKTVKPVADKPAPKKRTRKKKQPKKDD